VQNTETSEALGDLGGRHGGAVVAEGRSRQAALLERLRQPVRNDLGGLGQIPLQMTGEPRAIVDDAEQDRRRPLTTRRENLARAMMTVPVPEAIHVLGLVAADLAIDDAGFGAIGTIGRARR